MLDRPPRWRETTLWIVVVLWSLLTLAMVPAARVLREWVSEQWGREWFLYIAAAGLAAAAIALARWQRRRALGGRERAALMIVAGTYAVFVWRLRAIPEEAVHLLQYGVLGVLAFVALRHRVADSTIYVSACLVAAIVGIVDEIVQWATPGRYWSPRDVRINVAAAGLAQIAIAAALRPRGIVMTPQLDGIRVALRLVLAVLVLAGLAIVNTPQRIDWYSMHVPGLGFLRTNEDVMLEYGFLHGDSEVGRFRSRFTLEELRDLDRRRGAEAGRILARYPDDRYDEFLRVYSPVTDPFVHEARVHLFSRDKHLALAREAEQNGDENTPLYASGAWREHRILEKYFTNTFAHAGAELSGEDREFLMRWIRPFDELPANFRESGVSYDVITQWRERHLLTWFGLLLGAVLIAERIVTRRLRASS